MAEESDREQDPLNKFIAVNRDKFLLKLYFRPKDTWEFKVAEVYEIAIGAKGYETPAGMYLINTKVKHPDWLVPNSQWAIDLGLVPGTIVPGGTEENPLKERWLGVSDPSEGIGIHGTANIFSIGTQASHGCIRMRPSDVIELYDRVPKYTPVYIHGEYIRADRFRQLIKEVK
jgi:lipoprotein-anchoring transpeptidase ErfK/SrfK